MKRIVVLAVGSIIFVNGCNLEPKYSRPAAPVPASWPTGTAYKDANGVDVSKLGWNDFYLNPQLQKVIELSLANNRDLRIAALNIQRFQQLYNIQRADLFPTINASASYIRNRVPADLSGIGRRNTVKQANVDLGFSSYELDFFGRLRSLKKSAFEQYLSTAQAQRSLQISLVAQVASAYFALGADRERLKLAQDTYTAQSNAYNLIKRRYEKGTASELDLYQAQTRVDAAKVDIATYTGVIAQDENLLNLLVGSTVPKEFLPTELGTTVQMRNVTAGLNSDVLQNRPDVLLAEHDLKSANADIGAARANFFPRIALTSAVGTASTHLSGLFESGSGTWAFVPVATLPIFDAGRIGSIFRASVAQRDILVAQYERTIQSAFREVADALAQYGTVGDELGAQQSLVDATAANYRLAEVRYLKGIDNYLVVLDAQRSLYDAQQGLISIRQGMLVNRLTLYKVLGGGA